MRIFDLWSRSFNILNFCSTFLPVLAEGKKLSHWETWETEFLIDRAFDTNPLVDVSLFSNPDTPTCYFYPHYFYQMEISLSVTKINMFSSSSILPVVYFFLGWNFLEEPKYSLDASLCSMHNGVHLRVCGTNTSLHCSPACCPGMTDWRRSLEQHKVSLALIDRIRIVRLRVLHFQRQVGLSLAKIWFRSYSGSFLITSRILLLAGNAWNSGLKVTQDQEQLFFMYNTNWRL